ncbi:MAG: hypothetical protein Q9159_006204 [Coniocarpon cinnabarinum]
MIFNSEVLSALGLASHRVFGTQQPFDGLQEPLRAAVQCSDPPLSCSSASLLTENSCCINSPGGLLLQTQFWDTHPASGPSDSWTIHGLWPDNCDGSWQANCDHARSYHNISDILASAGATGLVDFMRGYWKDEHGRDEVFWEHEWNKHGTCISTLEPICYAQYEPQREVVDYFNATVNLFQTRDSFKLLKNAGIEPDSSRLYPVENVIEALAAGHKGVEPAIHCTRSGELNEIWYFFNTRGSLRAADFVPAEVRGSRHDCPHLVKYLPKRASNHDPEPQPPQTPFLGRGILNVEINDETDGCLISRGTWFRSGACAKFTVEPFNEGISLRSRRGYCNVRNNAFGCGDSSRKTAFQHNGSALMYDGSLDFFADGYPSGSKQSKLYTQTKSQRVRLRWDSV